MADVIFMVCVNIFAVVMLFILIAVVYFANLNRPFRMGLADMNHSKSASDVDLEPYLQIITDQFPHALDSKSNG